jgi:hypothetical protein
MLEDEVGRVNEVRIKKKLPLLMTEGSSLSWEYQKIEILTDRLKRFAPDKYSQHHNQIVSDIIAFKKDIYAMEKPKKKSIF